jgi:hypothetical protein
LPAVDEVGGEILLRLGVLNSVLILIPPLRARDRPVATGVLGALQQGFYWSFILLSGWVCIASFCVIEFENLLRAVFTSHRPSEMVANVSH